MLFNVGDLVTRQSYNNDIVFRITLIKNNNALLKGVNSRLIADAYVEDLNICRECIDDLTCDDNLIYNSFIEDLSLDRNSFFYLPGSILHLDSDSNFLSRCKKFYDNLDIVNNSIVCDEKNLYLHIKTLLEKYRPNVLVLTGHDAYIENKDSFDSNKSYKNSKFFVNAVKEARRYEKDPEKLVIIAGACQSNYEELIKAGANFASSPKRVNIHALDPAIVAASVCFSFKHEPIDIVRILDKTKCGTDGIGGIISNGAMYKGFPR